MVENIWVAGASRVNERQSRYTARFFVVIYVMISYVSGIG